MKRSITAPVADEYDVLILGGGNGVAATREAALGGPRVASGRGVRLRPVDLVEEVNRAREVSPDFELTR